MKNKHDFGHSKAYFTNNFSFNRTASGRAWDADDDLGDRINKRNFSFRRLMFIIPIFGALAVLGISLKNSFADTVYSALQDSGSYVFFDRDLNSSAISTLYSPSVTTVPTSFSLADTYTFPIENQGSLDTCVLFATNKAAETNYVMTHTNASYLNLSERYLDYYTSSNNIGARSVGASIANRTALTALETQGTPLESDFNYNDHTAAEFNAASPALRVTNTVSFPLMSSVSDKAAWRNILKLHIMKYGAITADLVVPNSATGNYNDTTHAYNYTGTGSQDHDVAIIGWDDNYDKSNFTNQPSENGAFIAINSWGSDWGENGLFYISYESAKFLDYVFGVLSTEPVTTSYTTNTNDKYLFTSDYEQLDKKFYGVVLDTEGENPYLSHIGFGLGSQTGAAVNIYLNPSSGSFDASQLVLLEQKTLDYSQNAITLKNPVQLTGDKYALVFEYTGENLAYSVANRSVDTLGTTNTYLNGSMYSADTLAGTWAASSLQFPVFAYTYNVSNDIKSIAIYTAPTQTVFSVGQSLDLIGLSLLVTLNDDSTLIIPANRIDITYDWPLYTSSIQTGTRTYSFKNYSDSTSSMHLTTQSLTIDDLGTRTVTVHYAGLTAEPFEVIVTDADADISWQRIPSKRTYIARDDFSLDISDGLIKADYVGTGLQTLIPLESFGVTVTGYNWMETGHQTITVTYLNKTLTYDIDVIEDTDDEGESDTPKPADDSDKASSGEDGKSDDKFPDDKIKAPDTGVFSHTVVTVSAVTSESIFLPIATIVIFGGLLAYDLARKH